MERLNKRQKEILTYLDEAYPFSLPRNHILLEFGEPEEIYFFDDLTELELLEEMKLIELGYGKTGDSRLTITPKGRKKLRENFKTRLVDAIHENPLKAISIGVALISVILGLITILI